MGDVVICLYVSDKGIKGKSTYGLKLHVNAELSLIVLSVIEAFTETCSLTGMFYFNCGCPGFINFH